MASPSTYVTAPSGMIEWAAPGRARSLLAAASAGEVKDGCSPPPPAARAQRASLTTPSTTLSVCENAAASRGSIGARKRACSVLSWGGRPTSAEAPSDGKSSLMAGDRLAAAAHARPSVSLSAPSPGPMREGKRETHRLSCSRPHQQARSRSPKCDVDLRNRAPLCASSRSCTDLRRL